MDLLIPEIFDKDKILSGLTRINKQWFPATGLSLAPADLLSEKEFELHLQTFSKSVKVPVERIKFNKQIHSDVIHTVDETSRMAEGDAIITNVSNLMIYVKIADCAAILIHDTEKNIIAAVHSGWRGTLKKILPKTLHTIADKFGSRSDALKIWLSPVAQQKNYEVQKEFETYFPDSVSTDENGKFFFSNKKELLLQLHSSGINPENIEYSDICTIENEEYHSFRRDGKKSGRMAAFIMMK